MKRCKFIELYIWVESETGVRNLLKTSGTRENFTVLQWKFNIK